MSDAAYVSMAATQEARWRREERAAGVAPPANIQGPTLYNYRRDGRTLLSTTAADFSGNGTPHLTDDGHWGYWTGRPGDPNVAWHEVTIGEMAQNAADGLYGLGKEFVLGAWDTAVSLGELARDLAISGSGAMNPVLKFSRPVQEADARLQSRISNISFHGVMDPIVYGIDQALTHDNFRPAARALGGIAVGGGITKTATVLRIGPAGGLAGRGTPINGATRSVPLGFKSSGQFANAVVELQGALRASGIDGAVVGVRGSSVTGVNFKTGAPFGTASDIDFFVQSPQITGGLKGSRNILGTVHPNRILKQYPELRNWSSKWSDILGRPVKPAGVVPGMLSAQPAIIGR